MGKLVDICQSSYPHKEMRNFSDKHFFNKYGTNQILCEECITAWILESSIRLAKAAYRRIKKSKYTTTNYMISNFLVMLPEYTNHLTCNTVYVQIDMQEGAPAVKDVVIITNNSENETTSETVSTDSESTETTQESSEETSSTEEDSSDDSNESEVDTNLVIGQLTMDFYLSDDPSTINPVKTIVGFGNDCGCSGGMTSVGISHHHSRVMPIPQVLFSHKISIQLTIRNTESEDTLVELIKEYLTALVNTCYEQMDDDVVQVLMDEAGTKTYSSDASDCPMNHCAKCGASLKDGYYLYNRKKYCVNCMYDIVKILAIDTKLAAEVGIALDSDYLGPKNLIADSLAWKRLVIDRYINAMKKAGACPGIHHVS